MKKNCRISKKKKEKNNNSSNAVGEEVQDVLLLLVDNFIDSQVMDLSVPFSITSHHEITEDYVAGNYGNVQTSVGELMDIVGIGDINLRMSNQFV